MSETLSDPLGNYFSLLRLVVVVTIGTIELTDLVRGK